MTNQIQDVDLSERYIKQYFIPYCFEGQVQVRGVTQDLAKDHELRHIKCIFSSTYIAILPIKLSERLNDMSKKIRMGT